MKLVQAPIERTNCIFEELPWDTAYFGVSSAKLSITGPMEEKDRGFLLNEMEKYRFVTISCAEGLPRERQWIAGATGAFLADTNVHLVSTLDAGQGDSQADPLVSVCANIAPDPAIEELAQTAFTHTRFLNDSHIPVELSRGMYRIWVQKSFEKPDKWMSIARVNGVLGGFIIFSSPKEGLLRLELVAVSEAMRGQGLGSRLMNGVRRYALAQGIRELHVDTQLENLTAIRYYIHNGFSPEEVRYTYHWWQ